MKSTLEEVSKNIQRNGGSNLAVYFNGSGIKPEFIKQVVAGLKASGAYYIIGTTDIEIREELLRRTKKMLVADEARDV